MTRIALAASRGKRQRAKEVASRRGLYEEMGAQYAELDAEAFYAAPPPIHNVTERPVRRMPGGHVYDLSWSSGYEPRLPSAREPYLRWPSNRLAHVRLLQHDARGVPALIWLHGYRGGPFAIEERMCRARTLFESGLDVALFTLPFHGARAPSMVGVRAPLFPSQGSIPRTNEGMGQMAWDVRGLMGWLRARGASRVGVAGMSLGGYCAALLGTVERSLDFVIPFIPLADITDAVVSHEALRGLSIDEEIQEASRQALAIHRPLARASVVPGERVLVVGAEQDRITGRPHAERLARHFDGELAWFHGGHLFQFGRSQGFAAIRAFLSKRC